MTGQQERLEPTRRGGVRRTGIAQKTEPREGSATFLKAPGQSTTQIKWRRAVRIPHPVLKLAWRERLGRPGCPYVIRWRLETPLGSVRAHHWLGPDDDRAFHDHPWWFATLVVRGGYTDRSPDGDEHLAAGAARFRPALHRHTVVPDPGGAWTVLLTGPPRRAWGFWLDGKFRKANKWFASFGHHPCAP